MRDSMWSEKEKSQTTILPLLSVQNLNFWLPVHKNPLKCFLALNNLDSYCFRASAGMEHLCKWLLKYCNICFNSASTLKHSRPLYFVRWLTLLRGTLLTWKLQKLWKKLLPSLKRLMNFFIFLLCFKALLYSG